jgi:hypothetical protein
MARYKQLTCPEEILQEKDDEEWIQQRLPRSPFLANQWALIVRWSQARWSALMGHSNGITSG